MRLSYFIFLLAGLLVALSCTMHPATQSAIPSTESIDSLIQQLKDENPEVRWNAARSLGEIKDARAIEPLIAAMKDKDSSVRSQATWALKEIGKPAVAPLIAVLEDEDPDVRWQAAWTLGAIKDSRAVKPLIAALKDENPSVRSSAAAALGAINNARAVEPLIAALKDENPHVRGAAAGALAVIKDARAVEPLIAAMNNDVAPDVRSQAFEALRDMGKPAVGPLIAIMKNDVDPDVRMRAAWILGLIKDTHAIEPLNAALEDENPDVRSKAAWSLGWIKDARAVEPLIAALNDEDPNVRSNAAVALGDIEDARAVEPLIAALEDEYPNVRGAAAYGLHVLKDTRAVEPLIAALKDEDSNVRVGAVEALEWIRDSRAVEPLIAALEDENMVVRMRAAHALGEIRDVRAIEPLTAVLQDEEYNVRSTAKVALGIIRSANNILQPVPELISFDIEVDVSLSNAPALNQTAELMCKAFSQYGAPDAVIQINLPEGLALVDGNLAWQGNISENQTIEFTATVKAVKTGYWGIDPLVKHQFEGDLGYWRQQVNSLTLTIAEDNTQIENISGTLNEINVDKRTGKSLHPELHASTLTREQQAEIDRMIQEKKNLQDKSELRFPGGCYVIHVAAGTIEKGIRNDEEAHTNQYYVIQFYDDQASVDKETRDKLKQIGCVLYDYIQINAFYAKIPPEALDTVISLVNDGEVRYLGRIPTQAKIYQELRNKAKWHPFTSIPVVVMLFPDVTQSDIDYLKKFMRIDSYYGAPTYFVYGSARGFRINNIFALPIVHWIEEQSYGTVCSSTGTQPSLETEMQQPNGTPVVTEIKIQQPITK